MTTRQTHLTQTLQDMRGAQGHLQTIHRMSRQLRTEAAAGGRPDPTGGLRRALRNGAETQSGELSRAAHCLRTMYPAANDAQFEVAL